MRPGTNQISVCRICSHPNLEIVIDFGSLSLTGVFLTDGKEAKKEPLVLSRCTECGLVQLGHSYLDDELYTDSYGYESHLNQSMVLHLQQTARNLEEMYLGNRDVTLVVDIASNDGTLLSGYQGNRMIKIGVDPLLDVVADHYPKGSKKIKEFFSADEFWKHEKLHADLVTSLSVLYDLDDPVCFARDIYEILKDGGIWYFEQSYLPLMLEAISYDTICHEHLLYLSLHNIMDILAESGFKIIDAKLNSVNGGSIAISAIKTDKDVAQPRIVQELLKSEIDKGIVNGAAVQKFAIDCKLHIAKLKALISQFKLDGSDLIGFGASTKGNVLLQILGLDQRDIRAIGEINPRKFGRETPGSSIPIVSEKELVNNSGEKTIALVLPWHFKEGLLVSLQEYLEKGGKLIFPLPTIEVISKMQENLVIETSDSLS
jgi:SAM-dependent methyltransferase